MLRSFPASATPMEVLRTAVSALSFYDADEKDNSHDANVRKCLQPDRAVRHDRGHLRPLRKGLRLCLPTAH